MRNGLSKFAFFLALVLSIGIALPSPQQVPQEETFDPYDKQYTAQDFVSMIEKLKQHRLVPKDFIPTYENNGIIGPHSRIAMMRETSPGPWQASPEEKNFWWECYIHVVDAQGNYAGMIHLKISLKTGEIWEVEYSPFGDVLTYRPYDSVVLYEDLKTATRISSHAFYDIRVYKSLAESGYVPAGYRTDPQRPIIKRQKFGSDSASNEYKVYEFGYVGDQEVEVHYFLGARGEVSQVEFYPFRTSRGVIHKIDIEVGKTQEGRPIQKKFRIDLLSREALEANRNGTILNFIESRLSRYIQLKDELDFVKREVKTFFSSRLPRMTLAPDPHEQPDSNEPRPNDVRPDDVGEVGLERAPKISRVVQRALDHTGVAREQRRAEGTETETDAEKGREDKIRNRGRNIKNGRSGK